MNTSSKSGYKKGFVPFAVAAAILSLCGGFTAAVPSNIVADWALDAGATTWITLAYSLGAAAMAPIMGKLGDVVGRRRMLLTSMILYTLGQLFIALCPTGNLVLILAFRFLVGVGAAGIAPVVVSYIMSEFPPEKINFGFTLYMFLSCGMVIFGPTIGGLILTVSSWRVVMYVCVILCLIAFAMCVILVKKEDRNDKTMAGFDFVGAVFVLVFFSLALSIPTFGQNNGWLSSPTLICVICAVVALIALILVEKRAQNPILNGKFMARKEFIIPVVILFLSQGLQQACMTNTILFSIYTTGDRTLAGIATSVMYVGMSLGTIVLAPLSDKKEPRSIVAVALVLVGIGSAMQLLYTENTPLIVMCIALFLLGLGLGGNGTIFMKIVFSGLDPALSGAGSGTYNVFRDMAAPFGVAVFVPMFSSGLAAGTATNISAGMSEELATVQACVHSIHTTAMAEVASVVVALIVCFMLPKIREKKALS